MVLLLQVLSFPDKPLFSHGLVLVLWGCAACGVSIEALCKWKHRDWLAIGLYVTMGWAALACVYDLYNHLDVGFAWMAGGGMAYMFGIPFFVIQEPEYMHVIWHMWVILGAVIHWYFILEFVIPKAVNCQDSL